jgi:TolB-like protein/thioredoxin-like negative regulator of GroEL
MASIVPGYEYDVFISYRQKDNKGDRWVSEFVEALKTELESTFKEEISVYFDINPHDGLLETHDVNASLKEKLKCLIFIPVISQTYCDPKSFAWQHELAAFNKMAEDQFGRDIRLAGGNIASRILPIKIHDLDQEDKTLLENELGGVLRSIEFIYKASGVNRPLKPNDERTENLNHTYYRDQINKVANAVKEIITAIKKHNQQEGEISREVSKAKPERPKTRKLKIIIASFFVLSLIALGYFFIPKLSNSSKPVEKSIAVLPFRNDSPNDSTTYFINGIMEEVLNNLQKIKELRIISRTSVERYRNQNKSTPEIAKELGVNYIVEGSGQKYGNTFRLRVQLISAAKESHLWAESYEQEIVEPKDIFKIQSQIAQAIATELEAVITPQEKQLIEKTPTANLAAYDVFLKGQFFYEKNDTAEDGKAIFWFKESIKFDSTFALPWTYLSMCYWRMTFNANSAEFKEAKRIAEKAFELDPTSGTAIVNMAEILDNEYDFEGAEEKIKLALKIDPNNPFVLRNAGRFYTKLGRIDESISFCNRALQNDLNNSTALLYLALAYFYSGRSTEAWTILKKSDELEYKELHQYLYYQLLLEEDKIEEVVKEPRFEKDDNTRNVALAAVNFKLNNKNIAEKLCADLIKKNIPGCAYWIAFAHAYGDEPEKVYLWLERSFAAKEIQLTYLGVDPAFKKFRNEPMVKKLLQKMKFPI